MVQVLPNNKRPSFSEQVNQGLNAAIPAIQSFLQQREMQQQKQQQMQALQKLGIDPSVAQLPENAQAEYFKNAFAREKPLDALQQAKLEALQRNKNLFEKFGDQFDTVDQKPTQQQTSVENVPEQTLRQIAAFAGQPGQEGTIGNMAKAELDRREKEKKLGREEFLEERKFHSDLSKKSLERADVMRESIPKKESALDLARNAIETGDMSFFTPDKLADATGIELFRTAKGAQLTTALKENFMNNMSRVSAKAQNIWFEKRLATMAPEIGRSREANLSAQEIIEGELAMDKAYLEAFDRISEEDNQKYGFEKKDIEKRARDAVKSTNKEILSRTSYRLKELEEQEKGLSKLKSEVGKNVVKGTPLTLAMAKLYKDKFGDKALDVAKKNGYTIPSIEEFRIYQQNPSEFRQGFSE